MKAEPIRPGSGEVLANWDRIKREQEGRSGLFADVPENLPALLRARKLQRRVVNRAPEGADTGIVGADGPEAAFEAVRSALRGLESAAAGAGGSPTSDDAARVELDLTLGELLFAAVEISRRLGADPELALRAASERFRTSIGEE